MLVATYFEIVTGICSCVSPVAEGMILIDIESRNRKPTVPERKPIVRNNLIKYAAIFK
jgi:hypothetical protein